MRTQINKAKSSVRCVVLMSMMCAAIGTESTRQPDPSVRPIQPARYADATWIKLADLVPMETAGPDVYVRLIAIEGEVLLPADHVR